MKDLFVDLLGKPFGIVVFQLLEAAQFTVYLSLIAFVGGGALGLIIAARIGWPETYALMGAILLGVGFIGLWAPNASENAADVATESERQVRALRRSCRRRVTTHCVCM